MARDSRHLFVRQLVSHAPRQHPFDESVPLEDQFLSFAGRSELAENKPLPGRDRPDELHEGEAAHEIRASLSKVKGEARSPVLRHEVGGVDPHFRDEGVEIARVVLEAIGDAGLARLAKADEVGSDATGQWRDERENLAPDEG
jgi:hypothetical protein